MLLGEGEKKEIGIRKRKKFGMFFLIMKSGGGWFFRMIVNVLKDGEKVERKKVLGEKVMGLGKEN